MRAGVLFLALALTGLVCVIISMNSTGFKEILLSNTTWPREQDSRITDSNSIIVVKSDNESSSSINVRGAQIFINCTCPAYVEPNKTGDCSHESELSSPLEPRPDQDPPFSILLGVLTRADLYERRHFLRMVYGIQSTPLARIDVKFVFCSLYKDDQRILVPLEIMRYNDIIILDCEENMNNGKSYTYFSSLPTMGLRYDYVMKVDDDIYFRYDKLAQSLKPLPREDTYYGFVIPCGSQDPFRDYMAGMGYALSWDLVEWIQSSPIAKNKRDGVEDMLIGIWLNEGNKGKNRFNAKPAIYNFPGSDIPACAHDLVPDTIAVHKLKDRERWFQVLKYFNVTSAVKESKLYHL